MERRSPGAGLPYYDIHTVTIRHAVRMRDVNQPEVFFDYGGQYNTIGTWPA